MRPARPSGRGGAEHQRRPHRDGDCHARFFFLRAPRDQAAAEELSANGFRTVMEIDTLGTFTASRAAFPELRKAGGGAVINISATLHYGATWWQARLRGLLGVPLAKACDLVHQGALRIC